jgi:hypothetical protein
MGQQLDFTARKRRPAEEERDDDVTVLHERRAEELDEDQHAVAAQVAS